MALVKNDGVDESTFCSCQSVQDLVAHINKKFEKEFVNVDYLLKLMNTYNCDIKEFTRYAHFQSGKCSRYLIDKGNGEYNLLLLCWSSESGSIIHDHSNSDCILKCIEGTLNETRYERPTNVDVNNNIQEKKK
ncbi:unnamed protein product [Rotaria magnacalcarata]|uniref:Cysteine dioxygenase n=1 Tax=Rotaria magnacalcarata TaxID=392030 RepID=A0A815ALD5_9BILA|nr:unnamed protein product [Rotaria magnacalcarata]CAF5016052.1 unnamed protein product [Rotaria magnacalcarata]